MMILLSILWFLRTVRIIFFYVYLWQLKEYHIGRFLDHFRTAKGKGLLLHPLKILKFVCIPVFFFFPLQATFALGVLYALEALLFARDILNRTVKRPIRTAKTAFLLAANMVFAALLFIAVYAAFQTNTHRFARELLYIDIAMPLLVSFVVLAFQPLAVFGKNKIIRAAKQKREQFKGLTVVGITGSYGKTTTKEFLAHILSKKFNVLKTKEHQNSEVGVSNCVLQELKSEHEVFVCEMGAYNRGGIKLLASIAKPSIGVLTGINQQHMATFGSQENIIKAKYELIESLPANGAAFFNARNAYCVDLYDKTKIKKALYGQTASFPGEENLLGAMAVAKELGMTDQEISGAVKEIDASLPGAKIQKTKEGLTVIEATYSANPDGVMAALEYLKKQPGKKILVMPCLIELGKASKEVHIKIGKKIREVCDLAIITTKDRFSDIIGGAGGSEKIVCIENPQEIVQRVKGAAAQGDTVFLEGRVPQSLLAYLL